MGDDKLGQQFGERGQRGRLNHLPSGVCGLSDDEGGTPLTEQESQKRVLFEETGGRQGKEGGIGSSVLFVWLLALFWLFG